MVRDHLGNEYETLKDMCRHYGISSSVYCHRREYGYSLEERLTGKRREYVWDPQWNRYESIRAMCQNYGVNPNQYIARRKKGWTVEEALTGKRKIKVSRGVGGIPSTDHLGNRYPTIKAMCDHYGIAVMLYRQRISGGWTLEDALTKPPRRVRTEEDERYEWMLKMRGLQGKDK